MAIRSARTLRPSTRTLNTVAKWLESQGLSVYGPNVQFDAETQSPGNLDYNVEMILKLYALNKKYPEGIPKDEEE